MFIVNQTKENNEPIKIEYNLGANVISPYKNKSYFFNDFNGLNVGAKYLSPQTIVINQGRKIFRLYSPKIICQY